MKASYPGRLLICFLLASVWAINPSVADEGWVSLFDGSSLAGWNVKCREADKGKAYWTVKDGAITCDSMQDGKHDYVWLLSDKEYTNFELRMKIRSHPDSPGNSGIQVRSRYDEQAQWLDGPQVDIHPPAAWRSGLIYDETRGVQRWISPSLENWRITPEQGPKEWKWLGDDWNEVQIRCVGTRITTRINGFLITDYDGKGVLDDEAHASRRVGLNGFIALQLHKGDRLHMAFKGIFIRVIE